MNSDKNSNVVNVKNLDSHARRIEPLAYDVTPLQIAIANFEQSQSERNLLWENVECKEDVIAAELADQEALKVVQEAFYEVTKDRNSMTDCLRVKLSFMKKIASDI